MGLIWAYWHFIGIQIVIRFRIPFICEFKTGLHQSNRVNFYGRFVNIYDMSELVMMHVFPEQLPQVICNIC